MARQKKRKTKTPERIIVKSVEDDIWPEWGYWGGEDNNKNHEMHIGNDLFTLDITGMDAYCDAEVTLMVKGKPADVEDFGDGRDIEPNHAPLGGCGNYFFEVWEESPEILEKYGITVEEYDEIGFWLQRCLTIGCCDWCG